MGGLAKVGKSYLVQNLIRDVTKADRPLWGIERCSIPQPLRVLYVEQELGEIEFQRRLYECYQEELPSEHFYWLSRVPLALDTAQGVQTLSEIVHEHGIQVVVIDPISRAMEGSESNEHIKRLGDRIQRFQYLTEDLKTGLVLVHHFGKPVKEARNENFDELDPYNFRGGSMWVDIPNTLTTFKRLKPRTPWRLQQRWTYRGSKDFENPPILGVYPELEFLAAPVGGI